MNLSIHTYQLSNKYIISYKTYLIQAQNKHGKFIVKDVMCDMAKCPHHDDLKDQVDILGRMITEFSEWKAVDEERQNRLIKEQENIKDHLEEIKVSINTLCITLPTSYICKEDFEKLQSVSESRIVKIHDKIDNDKKNLTEKIEVTNKNLTDKIEEKNIDSNKCKAQIEKKIDSRDKELRGYIIKMGSASIGVSIFIFTIMQWVFGLLM